MFGRKKGNRKKSNYGHPVGDATLLHRPRPGRVRPYWKSYGAVCFQLCVECAKIGERFSFGQI